MTAGLGRGLLVREGAVRGDVRGRSAGECGPGTRHADAAPHAPQRGPGSTTHTLTHRQTHTHKQTYFPFNSPKRSLSAIQRGESVLSKSPGVCVQLDAVTLQRIRRQLAINWDSNTKDLEAFTGRHTMSLISQPTTHKVLAVQHRSLSLRLQHANARARDVAADARRCFNLESWVTCVGRSGSAGAGPSVLSGDARRRGGAGAGGHEARATAAACELQPRDLRRRRLRQEGLRGPGAVRRPLASYSSFPSFPSSSLSSLSLVPSLTCSLLPLSDAGKGNSMREHLLTEHRKLTKRTVAWAVSYTHLRAHETEADL
eukprot:707817-Rhodomonas_salina.1